MERNAGARRALRLARTQLWALLNDPTSSNPALAVSAVVMAAIVLSSTTFCMETVDSLNTPGGQAVFAGVEHACIAIFTAEYLARLLTCPKLREFLLSGLNAIDLVAIVPYYVERGLMASGSGDSAPSETRIVRIVRLLRVLRVLKLGSRFARVAVVSRSLAESADMLGLLLFLLCVCMVVCSSLIYYAERGTYLPEHGFWSRVPWDQACYTRSTLADPNAYELVCVPTRSPFRSIPSSFWWCLVTLMTVGYGDVFPVTPGGKVVAGITMVIAVLLLSLPISVIGTEFTQQWLEYKAASHMTDRRRKAPRFMALRRRLAAHNTLLDELLLKTRDVLFEIDDLMARLQDKQQQRAKEHATAARKRAAAAALGHGRGHGAEAEASARDVKHETEMLFMELELKQRLMRLQELLSQAEKLRHPAFLLALEHCRDTYVTLQRVATEVAAVTEESDELEQQLEEALSDELAQAQEAADAAAEARSAAAPRPLRPSLTSRLSIAGSVRRTNVSFGAGERGGAATAAAAATQHTNPPARRSSMGTAPDLGQLLATSHAGLPAHHTHHMQTGGLQHGAHGVHSPARRGGTAREERATAASVRLQLARVTSALRAAVPGLRLNLPPSAAEQLPHTPLPSRNDGDSRRGGGTGDAAPAGSGPDDDSAAAAAAVTVDVLMTPDSASSSSSSRTLARRREVGSTTPQTPGGQV
jgi:hypothetical protein